MLATEKYTTKRKKIMKKLRSVEVKVIKNIGNESQSL